MATRLSSFMTGFVAEAISKKCRRIYEGTRSVNDRYPSRAEAFLDEPDVLKRCGDAEIR